MVTWGSPKEYQSDWGKEVRSVPAKLPKPKSKYCKKLKGPHEYNEWKLVVSSYSNEPWAGFYERFCKACNKKKTWIAPNLPGPFWKLDPDARPPEDQ